MRSTWTFGQKIGAGFGVLVLMTVALGVIAVYALRSATTSMERVLTVDAELLVDAERLNGAAGNYSSSARGFLLTKDQRFIERMRESSDEFAAALDRIRVTEHGDDVRRFVESIDRSEREYEAAVAKVIALRAADGSIEDVARAFDDEVMPRRDVIRVQVTEFADSMGLRLAAARKSSSEAATGATTKVLVMLILVALFSTTVAAVLSRTLGRQIGASVGQVQSSSAELQAAANQQVTGSREQATAMSEISTTINELLATSKQIAESAQRVAQIADQTTRSSQAGETTVQRAHDSITAIRQQVEHIVGQMLELASKSQQIGAVLEIVSELAEQTNILAINATIEAAGAGESGKRFAMVADEIRKLADRVGGSTKEIRTLIDDVRGSVNTTVMATESGSKTVDSGSRQFGDVSSAFKQIASLVSTTTEAAREIELSTKQQATAVEQVNLAIANVAQASKETEVSCGQTLQTASQLATLSRDLSRLVRSHSVSHRAVEA